MSRRPTPSSTGVLHTSMKTSHNASPTGQLASSIVSAGRRVTGAIRSLFTTKSFEQEEGSDSSDMIEPVTKEMAARTCGTQAEAHPNPPSPIRTPGNTPYDLNQSTFRGTPFPGEYAGDQRNLFPLALTTIAALALSQASRNVPIRQITDALTRSLASSYENPSMAMSALTLTGPAEFTSLAPEKAPTPEAEYVVLPSSILETYMALKAQRQTSALGIQKSTLLQSQTIPEPGASHEDPPPPPAKSRSVRFTDSATTGSLITSKQTTESSNGLQDSVSIASFSSSQKPTDTSVNHFFDIKPPEPAQTLALSTSNEEKAPTPATGFIPPTASFQKQETSNAFSFGSLEVKKEMAAAPVFSLEKQGPQGFVFPLNSASTSEPKNLKEETTTPANIQQSTVFQQSLGPTPTQALSISGQEKPANTGFSFGLGNPTSNSSVAPAPAPAPSFPSIPKVESKAEPSNTTGVFSFGSTKVKTETQGDRAVGFQFGSTGNTGQANFALAKEQQAPTHSTFTPSQATTTRPGFSFSLPSQSNPSAANPTQNSVVFQPPEQSKIGGVFGLGRPP
ncbi:hypothetical protein GMRT_12723 [Giardia muris]|uniref:Uncharacterized protein n=1 Tax=Giardia muris TaxID=5742 RepID=A0A4Z1T7L0_GIAMU|nr:hypothetical protein GMRT_12723 [Giardia muris]|eukprot:TNJ28559.1 hypothetical protein GMRT_12723 [Giardia muris]